MDIARNRLIKRSVMGLVAAGVSVALLWALWPKPVVVEVARLSLGALLVTVEDEGKTRIKDVYTVSAPITGKLVRLSLEAGDRVKKDTTTVAIIEPMAPSFLDVRTTREIEAHIEAGKAAVTLAEAEANQASAELEFAQSELTRARALIRSKTISERALERARIDVDTRQASVARARANLEVRKRELESAQARLIAPEEAWKGEVPVGCCVTVRAPVSGRVLRLMQESERVIAAGTPLIEIGDPDNLELVVELLSADAVKVIEGATATIEGWGGQPLPAKVTRVEPAGFTKVSALGIEEQRVRTILKLQDSAAAAGKLGHDYRVFVKIGIYETTSALRVPISALFRKGEEWAVYVIDKGRVRSVRVILGQRNAAFAEVLGGIAEGAIVVLHPSDRVRDGVRVVSEAGRGSL
ncbi:MAG TPA: HlyD family efflux transporter periplasmic adaptor subunit [Hyphomicrobiaceae bacterium]|nr:HlyD family efflux transporter periplasmic adaptor subunit [Hyphomicrobiaceae bacterium]